ncbi:Protein NRDE2 [Beauveria bassiana]|nr:Protein NRDE2 [Beauveria bassiana]KAH8716165.1 Protein NRDE2 [Beauveria bassiana]
MSGDEGDNLVVPKFGSFKSQSTQEKSKPRDASQKRDSRGERKKRSHDDRHERHGRDGSRESKRRRERPRSRERERRTESKFAEVKSTARDSGPELFILDTKGDPLIRRYGTLDRSQVPAYYRHGRGRVLGTSGRLFIHRDGPNESFSLRMPGEGLPRYRDRDGLRAKRPLAHSQPISLRRRRVAPVGENDEDEGFLSLRSSKKQKEKEDSSDDEAEQSYRSIEGKAKPKAYDSDMDSDTDSSDEGDDTEASNPMKWKSIQLNRRVKDNPEDVDAWLELVEHQDELLRVSTAEGTAPDHESHSYSEIKVSMLEKALANAQDAFERERILVPLMREGAKVWSSKVAAKKWAELGSQADSLALWRMRLEFAMTSVTEFDYTSVKTMLVERLRHLSNQNNKSMEAYLEMIEVLLLATRFVYDAGYRELAVAAWQAVLELTFSRPDATAEQGVVPDSFQAFWESEVPRVGEVGASGWKHYVTADGEDEPPEPRPAPSTSAAQSKDDAFKVWARLEAESANAAKLPARTMDEGTEDDPFRVVTYTDIEPFLFMVPQSCLSSISASLLDAFLIFCGLPPASSSEWARRLYKDQFLAPIGSNIPSVSIDDATHELHEDESVSRRPPLFDRSYSAFAISSRLLFSGKEWFSYFQSQLLNAAVDGGWLETLLGQLIFSAGCKDLSEYYLAISFARDPSSVKKTAKKLLKQSPDSASLYNAYALAEHARGATDVAAKVLESSLASSMLSQHSSRLRLHHTAAWIAFENGDLAASKRVLCAASSAEVSFADVLKARTTFSDGMSEALFTGDVESAETAAECLVLHSYLTNGEASEPMSLSQGNIAAAMQTLDHASQELAARGQGNSPSGERLIQFGAHLLYMHATRGPHHRVYIRDQVRKHLQSFPSNTILLSMLEWSDAGLRIVDETRQLLRDQAPRADSVGARFFAVQHELARGNAHTAQAAFEQAVRGDSCRASATLWAWYVRFAHAHRRQLRRGGKGAVDVLYRALRHCPWAKSVFMEAFTTLTGDLASDELRSVYGMMTAKGLRVHVELDEVVASRGRS